MYSMGRSFAIKSFQCIQWEEVLQSNRFFFRPKSHQRRLATLAGSVELIAAHNAAKTARRFIAFPPMSWSTWDWCCETRLRHTYNTLGASQIYGTMNLVPRILTPSHLLLHTIKVHPVNSHPHKKANFSANKVAINWRIQGQPLAFRPQLTQNNLEIELNLKKEADPKWLSLKIELNPKWLSLIREAW